MKLEKFETLHPIPGKTNKKIDAQKYQYIKQHIIAILSENAFTHTDLMEELYKRIHHEFDGGVQWYGEIVKLDLEARKLIFRTSEKPEN
jgi:hypothetical protein